MERKKAALLAAMLVAVVCCASAQVADSAQWHYRLSTGVVGLRAFGHSSMQQWVAPQAAYSNGRGLTVGMGFGLMTSVAPEAKWHLQGRGPASLAPRKPSARTSAVWAEATWQATDRLWLWGSVAHAQGAMYTPWIEGAVPVGVTAVSGGLAWEWAERNYLELHFSIVRDHYGSLPYLGGYSANPFAAQCGASPWGIEAPWAW